MCNACDTYLNAQININVIRDKIVKTKYLFIISCHVFKGYVSIGDTIKKIQGTTKRVNTLR